MRLSVYSSLHTKIIVCSKYRSFTGIAITMTPGKEFHPEGKQKSVFTFAKRCLKGAFWPFVLAVIVSIVGDIIAISSPISQRIFTDNLLAGKNTAWLYPFLGILGVILLIQILVGIIRSIYWLKIEGKFAVTSSSNFMWHVLRLPLEFFSQRNVADVVSRQESTSNIALTLIQKIGRGARTVDFEKELGYIPEFMKGKDKKTTKGGKSPLSNPQAPPKHSPSRNAYQKDGRILHDYEGDGRSM